ncbi:PREDICTED: general odorant-binding protein 83a-like [Nicrophorus vespilloides]|uniref:General odorant-binding protein 83a-like n=1 Tax=Nicrophorus vespilloides TaxID=110193 RepID=A0ABM1N444_NICVS|nr:PREDICTED: general odorant-binding protein 83a-like [Nicrophorus vespilloides]
MNTATLLLVFILGAINAAYAGLDENLAKALHAKCIEETGADEERIPNALKGEFPDDPKFKCYIKCITVNFGAMAEDGKVTFTDDIKKQLPDDIAEPISKMVNTCKNKLKSEDVCERAYELHKCVYDIDPTKYFLF